MESNVWGWNDVLREGRDLRDYQWQQGLLPEGELLATLDLKVWTKAAFGISCYFTVKDTGQKIRLTLFRRDADRMYSPAESNIDFRTCPYGKLYRIVVCRNSKGNYLITNFDFAS